jgi:hypothetical protein
LERTTARDRGLILKIRQGARCKKERSGSERLFSPAWDLARVDDGWGPDNDVAPAWPLMWQPSGTCTQGVRRRARSRRGRSPRRYGGRASDWRRSRKKRRARQERLASVDQEEEAPPAGGRRRDAGGGNLRRQLRQQDEKTKQEAKGAGKRSRRKPGSR